MYFHRLYVRCCISKTRGADDYFIIVASVRHTFTPLQIEFITDLDTATHHHPNRHDSDAGSLWLGNAQVRIKPAATKQVANGKSLSLLVTGRQHEEQFDW